MRHLILILILCSAFFTTGAQTNNWTENDRKYLLDNLTRSRDNLVKHVDKLTEKQWRFKESSDRWSINEVVEHVATYELLFQRLVSQSLASKPQPELIKSSQPDSTYFNFIMELKPHYSLDYTKPFTFTIPMGLNDGVNNLKWFLKLRNESIDYLNTTKDDLRIYYLTPDRPNVHQIYIWAFGHVDRAIRQIEKIKDHPNYPKK